MQKTSTYFNTRQPYLLLLLITLIAYWPLSIQLFSLKNDALVYFLPYRYQLSESIQQGCFPWWNPYIYTGLPIHSDIQSGVWNPVVMFISMFTTYNMSVLQVELLFYLFMAGIGTHKLVTGLGYSNKTALIISIGYICSGFITDSGSIIPWITSAAWLPFVFLYFLRIINGDGFKSSIKLGLALALLLTAGYPSFFIYCIYILFAAFICWLVNNYRQKARVRHLIKYLSIAGILFLIISSPAIFSWWDFLGYYERGKETGLDQAFSNSFPIFSSISYLIPSAVSRPHEWIQTDMSARNASIGIFLFLAFLVSIQSGLDRSQKFILAIVIFSFLFSLGPLTPIRGWSYQFLPLMDSFRHPANIRLFTSLGILLLSAKALEGLLNNMGEYRKKVLVTGSVLFLVIIGLLLYHSPTSNLLQKLSIGFNKTLLDKLSFSDILVWQGLLQIFFILGFLVMVFRKRTRWLPYLLIANSLLFAWMALPFTFISQVSTATVNNYVNRFPPGIPMPSLKEPINAASFSDSSNVSALGYQKFYEKKICIQDHIVTPTINKSYSEFLRDTLLRRNIDNLPFLHFSNATDTSNMGKRIELLGFTCNRIDIATKSDSPGSIVLMQQYHHSWKLTIDNSPGQIEKKYHAFMVADLPPGEHRLMFEYKPGWMIRWATYASGLVLLLMVIYSTFHVIKTYRRS